MRGEYQSLQTIADWVAELPPRARRIRPRGAGANCTSGTTSACAENTSLNPSTRQPLWNYLRVRGEYQPVATPLPVFMELPPRARRILLNQGVITVHPGTTSACAENTKSAMIALTCPGNYLRVRGEYFGLSPVAPMTTELPPRARRIQKLSQKTFKKHGTTSACAENTR